MNKTFSLKPADVKRQWYIVDAADQVLGRLATRVATVLSGKHKPVYTPHIDNGDFVVIINADKIDLTGDKAAKKYYHWHTEFPGGYRKRSLKEVMQKHPARVVEHAVKGMLPKGKLGRDMFRKLKVYAGDQHRHQAQQPQKLPI